MLKSYVIIVEAQSSKIGMGKYFSYEKVTINA
jgi:hypothetical protein